MYPNQIFFKTCRNRHLESFWIALHGIQQDQIFAQIKAEIRDPQSIYIHISGAIGFTITLPPQVNRERFQIVINRKSFLFTNRDKLKIHFIHNKTWAETEAPPDIDYRKGTGLLDVYLNSLRILLPDNAKEVFLQIADRFSQPSGNGFDPKIYVNYPIYTSATLPHHIFSHNLILLDQAYTNPIVNQFQDKLLVKYNKEGFEYKGEFFYNNYVILQVLPNPYNCRLSMLVVSSNSEELLNRHILLRKIILPMYINGIHKFWNNQILIYTGQDYMAVYENNGELEKLENISMRKDGYGREF